MPATRLWEGEAFEALHEPGLAAPYTTPEIQPAFGFARSVTYQGAEHAPQDGRIGNLGGDEPAPQIVEFIDRAQLRGVSAKARSGEAHGVNFAE